MGQPCHNVRILFSSIYIATYHFSRTSHARDNKLHVWTRAEELPVAARVGSVAQFVGEQTLPELCYSMDVNALNYCRFSLLPDTRDETQALVALPNLVDSTSVCPTVSLNMCPPFILHRQTSGSCQHVSAYMQRLVRQEKYHYSTPTQWKGRKRACGLITLRTLSIGVNTKYQQE